MPSSSSVTTSAKPLKTIAVVSAPASTKLAKVTLSCTLNNGTSNIYTFQYNPEDLEIELSNRFGNYSGVTYVPRIYYSGVEPYRLPIRFQVIDRSIGLMSYYNALLAFANPDPTVSNSNFVSPPLSLLYYGSTGLFKGYVEKPRLKIDEWNKSLMPIRGFLSFTFVVQSHKFKSAVSAPGVSITSTT